MTKKKRYKRYSPEFKRHVLKRASEDGMTDKVVCDAGHSQSFGIPADMAITLTGF